MKPHKTLQEDILLVLHKAQEKPVSIGDILSILKGKGKLVVLLFLTLPFCQPLPLPGFSTFVGLAIALIGMRMALGKSVWLPQKLLSKPIPTSNLKKIAHKILRVVKKCQPWFHARWGWIRHYPGVQIVNGALICLLGLLMAVPLPIPFSNMLAGWSILFLALGLLENDGVFVLLSYTTTLLTLLFFGLVGLTIESIV